MSVWSVGIGTICLIRLRTRRFKHQREKRVYNSECSPIIGRYKYEVWRRTWMGKFPGNKCQWSFHLLPASSDPTVYGNCPWYSVFKLETTFPLPVYRTRVTVNKARSYKNIATDREYLWYVKLMLLAKLGFWLITPLILLTFLAEGAAEWKKLGSVMGEIKSIQTPGAGNQLPVILFHQV